MIGKSKGTGLLDDSGKVVREIETECLDQLQDENIYNLKTCGWFQWKKKEAPVIDHVVNYQNDGMGCPTEKIKKPKATNLKRVK